VSPAKPTFAFPSYHKKQIDGRGFELALIKFKGFCIKKTILTLLALIIATRHFAQGLSISAFGNVHLILNPRQMPAILLNIEQQFSVSILHLSRKKAYVIFMSMP
jgi:hypothetical protein